jgi:hypothetical protein
LLPDRWLLLTQAATTPTSVGDPMPPALQ